MRENRDARRVHDVLDRQLGRLVERGVPRRACQIGTLTFVVSMIVHDLGRDAAARWLRETADALEDEADLASPTPAAVGHA